jgi:hypothetical protein
LSKHAAYVPKHRGAAERPLADAPKKALKTTFLLSALAVAGTGTAVGGGVVLAGHGPADTVALDMASPEHMASQAPAAAPASTAPTASGPASGSGVVRRADVVSRSDSRDRTDPAKTAALDVASGTAARAIVHTEDMSNGDPKSIASALLGDYGWSGSQFGCLVSLWDRESHWRINAANPSSGAYGIPQALPGSKMASAGPDWRTNAETQIKWGLGYIRDRYGSPCGAWGHSQAHGWY